MGNKISNKRQDIKRSLRERKITCAIEAKGKKERIDKDFPSGADRRAAFFAGVETRKECDAWYGLARLERDSMGGIHRPVIHQWRAPPTLPLPLPVYFSPTLPSQLPPRDLH